MRGIVGWSLQYRYLVVAVVAALMFFGTAQLRDMPVDVLPEFAPPFVEVQTESLGLSANEVEMLVSLNLEELLNGTPWLQTIRSRSVPGLSSLLLIFEPGTDILRARQLVQERLTLSYMLPNVSKAPVILQPLSATSRVMMVSLTSNQVSPVEMGVLAHWNIRPALMSVPGVANVSIWGQRERQLQVLVDPEQLRAYGVSLDQVIRTAGDAMWWSPLSFLNASTPGTGGWIDTPQQRIGIQHVLPISNAEDLGEVVISDAAPLRLGQVADLVESHQPLIGDAVLGGGPGFLLVVEKFPGANTLEVTRGVEARLEALRPGLSGMEIDTTVFRSATFLEMAMDNLTRTLLLGSLLVVLALAAFLFQWRSVLVSLVAIPLSLLAALLVLDMRGATMNVMVLAGLVVAIGAVVDDAVVDVENVVRRLRQHRQEGGDKPTAAIVLEASSEMRYTIAFATLITVLAVLPVFFMVGVSGAFFQPLAQAYTLALLASMVVALTAAPALSLLLLSRAPVERRESPLVLWLQRGYGRALSRTLRTPRVAYALAGAIILAGLAAVPFLGQEPFPAFKERDLMVRWETAPGTSHPAMTRLAANAGRELQSIPGVRNVAAQVGRAVMGDEVVGVNSAKLWVSVDPTADYDATVAAVRETVEGYPGVVQDVQTYLQDRIRQVLSGSSEAAVVRIFGPEMHVLRAKAEEVRQALSGIDGVVDLNMERQVEEPYVEIEVDLEKAELYGIKPGDVRRVAATLVNGLEAGSLFEQQKVFQVVVWSTPETRRSLTDVYELLIETPGGGYVRLEDVAEIRVASTLTTINREAVSRRIDVGFNVQGRDAGSVMRDVERRLKEIQFPLEYHAELLGEYADRQASQQRLLVAGAVAAMGIFLLLQAAFQSWRLAALTFLTLPLALVGGALAALAAGVVLSLGSMFGFLAVLGVAARNGIALISHYQHLEQQEGETFGPGLILRGSRERLAPILMTAIATGLSLTPFLLVGDVAGQELAHPMAVIIVGGLVTSTVLNLFVIPALYLRTGLWGKG